MLDLLFQIVIYPVKLIIEIIFMLFIWVFQNNYGIALAGVSLTVSFLCLPLYMKAEKLQETERDIQKKLAPKIKSIKKNFKGDEQYMILSAYYRENRYHPLMALRSSVSLLIQVPFFIAAYSFLSHLDILQGQSFFIFRNLGTPDGLLKLGTLSVNILPILMTAINIVSGIIYSKGFPLKEKLQLHVMAVFFLVLLYNSPSGLVIYWTLNNIFSLGKNIVLKLKHPARFVYICMCAALAALCFWVCFIRSFSINTSLKNKFLTVVGSVLFAGIPLYVSFIRYVGKRFAGNFIRDAKAVRSLFITGCLVLWFMTGVLIPLKLVASDPQVFAESIRDLSFFTLLAVPALQSFGFFFFWGMYLFLLAPKNIKALMSVAAACIGMSVLVNYFIFSGNYGNLSPELYFQVKSLLLSAGMVIANILVCILIPVFVLAMIYRNKNRIIEMVLTVCFVGIIIFAGYNVTQLLSKQKTNGLRVSANTDSFELQNGNSTKIFTFSKTGKNYLLIMLDRQIGKYVEMFFDDRTDIAEKYEGFTFYVNSLSGYAHTIFGTSGLFGGYEYTAKEMNKRSDVKMLDKHNEAIFWIPQMFKDRGFDVTLTDIPFVNYEWTMDATAVREQGFNAHTLFGRYSQRYITEFYEGIQPKLGFDFDGLYKRNLLMVSVVLTMPVVMRNFLYEGGNYRCSASYAKDTLIDMLAFDRFTTLFYLPEITSVEETGNTYTVMVNDLPHDPSFFEYPDYIAVQEISDFGPNQFNNKRSFRQYHSTGATLIQLAKWFDYLKEQGVYDNTRIIVVSDHGIENVPLPDFSVFQNETILRYNSTLLFKDFDTRGSLVIDEQFMSNVDVPSLMLRGVDDVVNPFTGAKFVPFQKDDSFYILANGYWSPDYYPDNFCILPNSRFWKVQEPIFDPENWKLIDADAVK